jgi:hypothetical protein
VGSVGDSYDNALAETINGLYKAEVIHRQSSGAVQSGGGVKFNSALVPPYVRKAKRVEAALPPCVRISVASNFH